MLSAKFSLHDSQFSCEMGVVSVWLTHRTLAVTQGCDGSEMKCYKADISSQ